MKPFEFIDHPSELRVKAFGITLEELFSNTALAMAHILKSGPIEIERGLKPKNVEKIKIASFDLNSLLMDFLSEILARSQIDKCVYKVINIKIESFKLEAELVFLKVEKFDEDVKAVTYEDLNIKKKDGFWQTIIVFDI